MSTDSDTTSRCGEAFASWVDWRQETCRGGRQLITAINRRTGHAIFVSPDDVDEALHRRRPIGEAARDLRAHGFLAPSVRSARRPATADVPVDADPDACPPARPERVPGALLWRGADGFVRRLHRAGLHRVFRRRWVIAQCIVGAFGVAALIAVVAGDDLQLRASPAQIPVIIALGLVAVAIHEFGHALATVHFGRHVRSAGLRLHLGSPAFFLDSLDALLLTRRQRLVQAAAGPWAEWLATTVALGVLHVVPPDGEAAYILHRFVVVNAIGIAMNLLPFVGLDGSMILADIVGEPDLSIRSREALTAPPGAQRRDRWLVSYGVANTIVGGVLMVTAAFFWWQLFGGLVIALWALGPIGIAAVVVITAGIVRTIARNGRLFTAECAMHLARLRSRVAFRLERRWRVEAMKAFRVIPEIATLDERALGVLAGRLGRVAGIRCGSGPGDGYVYIRRASGHASRTCRRGEVVLIETALADPDVGSIEVVVLPHDWRELARSLGTKDLAVTSSP